MRRGRIAAGVLRSVAAARRVGNRHGAVAAAQRGVVHPRHRRGGRVRVAVISDRASRKAHRHRGRRLVHGLRQCCCSASCVRAGRVEIAVAAVHGSDRVRSCRQLSGSSGERGLASNQGHPYCERGRGQTIFEVDSASRSAGAGRNHTNVCCECHRLPIGRRIRRRGNTGRGVRLGHRERSRAAASGMHLIGCRRICPGERVRAGADFGRRVGNLAGCGAGAAQGQGTISRDAVGVIRRRDIHRAKRIERWRVQFGAGHYSQGRVSPTDDQHVGIVEDRGCQAGASRVHVPSSGKLARGRVVQLSRVHGSSRTGPTCDEHIAIRQQRGRVVGAINSHAASGGRRGRVRIIDLGTRESAAAREQDRAIE